MADIIKTMTYEPVEEFYSGKSVLITGGTGFLGKVLIEKLTYSCPNIVKIYVLIRDKKHLTSQNRLKTIMESQLFSRIKTEKPRDLEKIVSVNGDITSEGLGLSETDKTLLLKKVSVVFHLAASIRFNDTLSEAMRINVEGTRKVIEFSKQIKHLQAFLYMSTAFSHTDQMILKEIVYPPPMTIEDVYDFLKQHGDDQKRVKEIIKDRPNTYTFTKAITESLVAESRGSMPTVIIRPSVVVAAMHEPIRGWIDTWIGPTPVLDVVARGWLRCLYGEKDYAFDIVPVDYTVNATIVAAARCGRSKDLAVYNCATSEINKLSLGVAYSLYTKQSKRRSYNDLPLNAMIFTKSSFLLKFITFIFQTVPAYIFDIILFLKGKPTRYVKMQRKLTAYLKMIRFFSSRSWYIMSTRLRELSANLDKVDRQKFPCNPADIIWKEFIPAYFDGVLRFLVCNSKMA